MVTYMMLMKLTDQGIKNVREAPERIESGLKAFEKAGGKIVGFWIAIGKYDSVKLFSREQFAGLIKMLK
jgi:uncharacterized protein with GYD domain